LKFFIFYVLYSVYVPWANKVIKEGLNFCFHKVCSTTSMLKKIHYYLNILWERRILNICSWLILSHSFFTGHYWHSNSPNNGHFSCTNCFCVGLRKMNSYSWFLPSKTQPMRETQKNMDNHRGFHWGSGRRS
jgi:hypothetical protein